MYRVCGSTCWTTFPSLSLAKRAKFVLSLYVVFLQVKCFHFCRAGFTNIILGAFPSFHKCCWPSSNTSPHLRHFLQQNFNGPVCTWLLPHASQPLWNDTLLSRTWFSPWLKRLRSILLKVHHNCTCGLSRGMCPLSQDGSCWLNTNSLFDKSALILF